MASSARGCHVVDGAVQNYAWGTSGESSLVRRFAVARRGGKASEQQPFAELWLGTHPSGVASVVDAGDGSTQPLDAWLQRRGYAPSLCYLFKILSVGQALSIQAHPDRQLAAQLHRDSPDVYRDANHKPEMVVALTPFAALCGFKPLADIQAAVLASRAWLALALAPSAHPLLDAFVQSPSVELLRQLFSAVAGLPAAGIAAYLAAAADAPRPAWLQRLHAEYPGDIGLLLAPLFFNYVELARGQSLFLGANEPHAYLSGDCLEIMSCSDNVVRAGLTPKLRDVPTLCAMLTYRADAPHVSSGERQPLDQPGCTWTAYVPPVDEFRLDLFEIDQPLDLPATADASLFLLLDGSVEVVAPANTVCVADAAAFLVEPDTPVQLRPSRRTVVARATSNFAS